MKKRVFVAGHQGMVGSAIVRALEKAGDAEIITRTRSELDLLDQAAVFRFFNQNAVDEVYLAAAKVGGIWANNTYPAEFIRSGCAEIIVFGLKLHLSQIGRAADCRKQPAARSVGTDQ